MSTVKCWHGSWVDLPPDLLIPTVDRLDITSSIRFATICTSWAPRSIPAFPPSHPFALTNHSLGFSSLIKILKLMAPSAPITPSMTLPWAPLILSPPASLPSQALAGHEHQLAIPASPNQAPCRHTRRSPFQQHSKRSPQEGNSLPHP